MGKAVSKLSKEDIKQLEDVTYFDKRQLQQWYKGFLRDCPSGQLSEEEFIKIYKQFFPFGDPTDYCHYLFRVFDVDASKFVDFKEFIIAFSISTKGTEEQKTEWSFRLYDHKREGKITYDDVLPVIQATYKLIGPMVELPEDEQTPELRTKKLFKLCDKNIETDVLTKDDFKKLAKKDANINNAINAYNNII